MEEPSLLRSHLARPSSLEAAAPSSKFFRLSRMSFDSSTGVAIDVPFVEKDEAKAMGAWWDPTARTWFVPRGIDAAPFLRRWSPSATAQRVNLNVPYEEKDSAKALGAKWDAGAKTWYKPPGVSLIPLRRWFARRRAAELDPDDLIDRTHGNDSGPGIGQWRYFPFGSEYGDFLETCGGGWGEGDGDGTDSEYEEEDTAPPPAPPPRPASRRARDGTHRGRRLFADAADADGSAPAPAARPRSPSRKRTAGTKRRAVRDVSDAKKEEEREEAGASGSSRVAPSSASGKSHRQRSHKASKSRARTACQ